MSNLIIIECIHFKLENGLLWKFLVSVSLHSVGTFIIIDGVVLNVAIEAFGISAIPCAFKDNKEELNTAIVAIFYVNLSFSPIDIGIYGGNLEVSIGKGEWDSGLRGDLGGR